MSDAASRARWELENEIDPFECDSGRLSGLINNYASAVAKRAAARARVQLKEALARECSEAAERDEYIMESDGLLWVAGVLRGDWGWDDE